MELVIENTSEKETELEFSSAKTHDFIIETSRGRRVWQWSSGRAFGQAFMTRTLKSGEKTTLSSAWDQVTDSETRAPAGKYTAKAEFYARSRFTRLGPISFEVTD